MERKTILYIATSLDGFIAKKEGGIDWLFTDQDYGYTDFIESVDTIIMGRKTYEHILTFGLWPYKEKECYVVTSKPTKQKKDARVTFISEAKAFIEKIKNQEGKHVWILGGGSLNAYLLNHELIDNLRVFVHPILLGEGIPLTRSLNKEKKFDLVNATTYDSGIVELEYASKFAAD